MGLFLQQLINGLTIGCLYALVALGYNLIVGVLNVLSFAHGAVIMIGSYGTLFGLMVLHLDYYSAIAFGILAATLVGLAVERVAVRPIKVSRGRDLQWGVIVATIGATIFIENAVRRVTTGRPEPFPVPFSPVYVYLPWGARVSSLQLIVMAAAFLLAGALFAIVYWTKLGRAIRAVAQSPRVASSVGINTTRVSVVTFGIASALGGAVGILYSIYYGAAYVFMGSTILGLKGLVVMNVAGIGNVPGCLVVGVMIGVLEVMVVGYVSSTLRDFIAYGCLVLILLIRPEGLFGERGRVEFSV
jgi:branched-chain amino acid transport system permease protein